uniref:Uncharacterized protein n=1 Tax=Oryza brachyantha TaxID=4533 RepID=J3M092_ORYBR
MGVVPFNAAVIEPLLWPEDKGGGCGGLVVEPTHLGNTPPPAAEAAKWAAPDEHGGGGGGSKEEWSGGELPPIPAAVDVGFVGEESWDAMFSDAAATAGQEQTFLNWIMAAPGDMEAQAPGLPQQ